MAARACCLAVALLALGACSKKSNSPMHLKDATDALSSAGFKTDGLHEADPGHFSAQKCVQGTLEGVDAVLCEYGSAEAVAHGKSAGEDWVAQATTGAVLSNGMAMLAVADRSRADPNGKVIHKLTKAFSGH